VHRVTVSHVSQILDYHASSAATEATGMVPEPFEKDEWATIENDIWGYWMTLLVSLITRLQYLPPMQQEIAKGDRPYFDIQNEPAFLGGVMRGNPPAWPHTFLRSYLRLAVSIWTVCNSYWTSDPLHRPTWNDAKITNALYEHSRHGIEGVD